MAAHHRWLSTPTGLTVTLKNMIITEIGQAMLLARIVRTKGARWKLIAVREHKLDLTRPDEIAGKTRIKGITELPNILTG